MHAVFLLRYVSEDARADARATPGRVFRLGPQRIWFDFLLLNHQAGQTKKFPHNREIFCNSDVEGNHFVQWVLRVEQRRRSSAKRRHVGNAE